MENEKAVSDRIGEVFHALIATKPPDMDSAFADYLAGFLLCLSVWKYHGEALHSVSKAMHEDQMNEGARRFMRGAADYIAHGGILEKDEMN